MDAMSNAGRGGRKEQRGAWEKQTGDFPVRWLLPLKLSAYHCSLIIVTNYHPLWIMGNSFLLSIEPFSYLVSLFMCMSI